ncbi:MULTISPECIES: alpha/beta fold hydrolase [Streptomyces]|uniref:Alpha/beta hydrolase n=2 Tax=Streptomyces TaxID=1883 RepID=A0A2N8PEM2_STRNR|nr:MULTISPECIES: alpha/beta hydrolase [Streptomyces]PNE39464.1 alpha/beta hydrolase [Streptomyces noursei]SHM25281.1 Pimeloyl-ACP methyl ester carboxylesterase [Streptomyces yunnanensis]
MALAYDVAGDGPTLVLLHSGVCDRGMWDPQWSALIDAGYRVVRCDFRGFGQTPLPDRRYNDAEDVLGLLDVLGIERAALVASSYGGCVALEIAARRPDRAIALALLCAGLPEHEPTDELRAFGEREDALLEAGDLAGAVELNVDTWLGPDAEEMVRQEVCRMQRHAFEVQLAAPEGAGRRHETEIDLSAIKAPCLAVSGAHDLADFRQIAAQLPGLLTNAWHLELPWAAHLPSLERPAVVTDLLTGFLRETVPAS